ncbi:PTS N-acetylgalactosamine transporter subunit IIC [Psittacicella hinzii]|uniref:PTS N-acetylgalactosamine transporter subunit IIC n=1 Tax=Psittacicella hinzii TaxID=2028575 RepID=A0A3A1YLT0_9GAMM|nr:PTS N-acetylgalactosamine transporter subunit IIC [Psittacicella hinzii]RIY39243.1 PTS N-acetylgalactosamine transporter subunit IIC [Psittacicella hinzii]
MLEAILIAIWAFFCGIDKYDVALTIHRPIITGPVVGLIMGDLTLGITTGAFLELAWLGLVPNAGAQPPDVTLGTIAAIVFQVNSNVSAETALGVGLPIAVLMQLLVVLFFTLTSFTMSKADYYADRANTKGIDMLLIVTICARGLLYAVIAFLTAASGQFLADFVTNYVPQEWLKGIGIGARMVPAIGFALLLKTMWSKEMAAIFFVGFVMTTYLNLPIMAVAILGAAAACIYYFFSNPNGNGGSNNKKAQVEEFEDGI